MGNQKYSRRLEPGEGTLGMWLETEQGQMPKAVGHTEKFGLYLPENRQGGKGEGLKQVCNPKESTPAACRGRPTRRAGLGRREENLRDLFASVVEEMLARYP